MNACGPSEYLQLLLKRLTARSVLGAEERAAVLGLPAFARQVSANREIVRLGERVDHSCLVGDGFVGRFGQTEDGKRQLTSLHIPGDLADLYSLMIPSAPSALVALGPTTVFQISHAVIREATERYPALAAALWRDCVVDGMILAQWLVNIGRKNARSRMAHLICEIAIRYAQIGRLENNSFPFPVTQEQMSDALGLTSVHVNRSLQGLKREGLVNIGRGRATILDWNALAFAGEFEPNYLSLSMDEQEKVRRIGRA